MNLLIADDVGLGKKVEAGLVIQELLLRHRARTVLVVCLASLCLKRQSEMASKFGLDFEIVDADMLRTFRRTRGLGANPFRVFPRLIVYMDWLKRPRAMGLLRDVLPVNAHTYPRRFDLLGNDEVHQCATSGRGKYAVDSQRTLTIREIAAHFERRLFLSATSHNGYTESFTALLDSSIRSALLAASSPARNHLRSPWYDASSQTLLTRTERCAPAFWFQALRSEFKKADVDERQGLYTQLAGLVWNIDRLEKVGASGDET